MKRWIAAVLVMLLFAVPAMAEEEMGTIVQSSCSIVQDGEYYLAYCFAKIRNNTDQVLCLDEGTFYLVNGDEEIASEEVSQLWPYFLAPGTEGYLFDIVPFEEMPQITGIDYDLRYLDIHSAYAGTTLKTQGHVELDEDRNALSVLCEVVNPSDTDAYDPTVVMGLYTDAGQLVYCDGRNLKDVGIAANGKLMVRFYVEPMLVEQWMNYGALPTQVQSSAMFRTGSD